ncbi:MAG: hemerythrin domain-containing protein [Acidimicrobiales bacterium]
MSSTTLPQLTVETAGLESVTLDLYRDVHKGIRYELFGVTLAAGQVDPGDRDAVAAVSGRWRNLVGLLITHAEHEDEFVQPVIELHAPSLAEVIAVAHPELEAQMAALEVLAERATDAGVCERRLAVHRLYLGLASFTAAYLQHQEFEELRVMPAVAAALGFGEVLGIHGAIIGSLTPEQMAQSGSVMLPAMNVEDRVELLGGAQAGAPPEVFAGMMGLAQSVISAADYAQVATRLGVA